MNTRIRIEFIGGSFDGHRQTAELNELQEQVDLPVSTNTYRMLAGMTDLNCTEGLTTIAQYRLEWRGEVAVYRFVKSYRPARDHDCQGIDIAAGEIH